MKRESEIRITDSQLRGQRPFGLRTSERCLVPTPSFCYLYFFMKESIRLALRPSVVRRALKYAVVVGLILITINHSDAILGGQVDRARLLKMALTVLVPYVVSTLSSVGALREKNTPATTDS